MGALTDTHKRYFVDIFSPLSPSPSPCHKKPRTSPPPAPSPVAPDSKAAPKQPDPARFPPAAPLRRPVQGPQRNIRVFGLGNPEPSLAAWRFGGWKMGNWMTRVESGGKRKASAGAGSGSGGCAATGLRLDEYKRLVEGLQEERGPLEEASEDVINAAGASPSKAVVAGEEDEKPGEEVRFSDGKEEEPMEMVKLEATPVQDDDRGWSRRTTPLYKELLEETSRKYDGKLRSLDFEVRLAEKKVSALRIIAEEKPKEENDGPFAPLTEEDENNVSRALQDPERSSQLRDVLVMHEDSNIEITREIIQCLRHGAWLNDEVINLYLELLKEREKRIPKKFLKCHFFNTFFYKKLTSGRGGYDFKAVRRWTTQRKIGYGLIECDKVFVPIHKDIHWCLAVINIKDEKFQYLDSLGKMDRGVLNVLGRYLVDEVNDKSNRVIDVKSWKQEFVKNLPLQKNGWDCGVFMIKYADFFSRGLALSFGQEHMDYFRKRTAKEILRLKAD